MGIDPETISDLTLKELLIKGYEIIDTRGDLFGEEFNNLYQVKETVLEALRKDMKFYKVTSKEKEKISRREFLKKVAKWAPIATIPFLIHGDTSTMEPIPIIEELKKRLLGIIIVE